MKPIQCMARHGVIPIESLELIQIDGREQFRVQEELSCCAGSGTLYLEEGIWRCSLNKRLSRLLELRRNFETMWEQPFQLKISDVAKKLATKSLIAGKGFRIVGEVGKPNELLWEVAKALVWLHGIAVYVGRVGDGLTRPQEENAVVLVDSFAGQKVGSVETLVSWCYGACLPFWISEVKKSKKQVTGRYAKMIEKKASERSEKSWFDKTDDPSLQRKLWKICHNKIFVPGIE